MTTPAKPSMFKYGISCLLSILTAFLVVFLITEYILEILDFLFTVLKFTIEMIAGFFNFTLIASPTIIAILTGISLWLLCMSEKLKRDGLLTHKFNLICVKTGKYTLIISIIFLANLALQSTSGFTALKLALTAGVFAQAVSQIIFIDIMERIGKPVNNEIPDQDTL
jgi:hypothetical protein